MAALFKSGRTSHEDDSREGRPKIATTPEIIQQVHDMVLDDRRVKVKEIADILGISKERVGYILHQELNMRKLCARIKWKHYEIFRVSKMDAQIYIP